MNDKTTLEDKPLEATPEEQKRLRQLRDNPLMGDQIKAIADRFEQEIANGMDAHQAEAALIESLQDLGKGMMHQWAQNTQRNAISQSSGLNRHSKKTPVAHHLRHDRHRRAGQADGNPVGATIQERDCGEWDGSADDGGLH